MPRKKRMIDKSFQLRTAFSVIGIVFIIISITIATIGITVSYDNYRLGEMIRGHNDIINTQKDTYSSLMVFERNKTWNNLEFATNNVKKDIERNSQRIENNIAIVRRIMKNNNILIVLTVAFVILQCVALYFVLIRKTHRISGPIFLMSQYMDELIAGKYPEMRPLREKDELKHFYEKFRTMVESLKKRKK